MNFNFTNEILQKMDKILVIEKGRDIEYWAGHYGAAFSGERLYLEISDYSSLEENKFALTEKNKLEKSLHKLFKVRNILFIHYLEQRIFFPRHLHLLQ